MTKSGIFSVFGHGVIVLGAGFWLYLGARLFMLKKFVLGSMVVVAALLGNACGDDASSDSPAGPADSEVTLSSSSDDVIPGNSSSSSVTESPSTSSGQAPQSAEPNESSSSEKAVGGSSSSDGKSSSSSGKVESSSSGKSEKSSSSEGAAGSSSAKVVAGSSSSEKSSSSVAESSSSVESSSSEEPSSSSVVESSSGKAGSSSSAESSSGIIESSSSIMAKKCKTAKEDTCEYGSLFDERNGKTYKTVKIGNQEWMAENLNLEYEGTSFAISLCDNDVDTCSKYGQMYYWPAVMDQDGFYSDSTKGCSHDKVCNPSTPVSGICPKGWHVPSRKEVEDLINAVGGEDIAAYNLKSQEGWWASANGNGADAYGFSLLPITIKSALNNTFSYGKLAYLTTSTELSSTNIAGFKFAHDYKNLIDKSF